MPVNKPYHIDIQHRLAKDYETVALVLQGGGALGAYQAGVVEGLMEAGIEPTWISGVSIGAINAAIIAGNPPATRLEKLRGFWNLITHDDVVPQVKLFEHPFWPQDFTNFDELQRAFHHSINAWQTLIFGQTGFFTPRPLPPSSQMKRDTAGSSWYDTAPLKASLEYFVDFDLINAKKMHFSVGAVNVANGNFRYFDNMTERICVEHVMASGALPPAFAPVKIGHDYYWDGGVVSNTPLEYLFDQDKRQDTLAFQIDLWSAKGRLPHNLLEVNLREKDIRYSSKTRHGTDKAIQEQKLRQTVYKLLEKLPKDFSSDAELKILREFSCTKVMNIIHLIYQSRAFESQAKDYEFSRQAMQDHWQAGLDDTRETLSQPSRLNRPSAEVGIVTHDIKRKNITKDARLK